MICGVAFVSDTLLSMDRVVTISLEMHMDVAPEMITCVRMVKPNHYRLGPTLSVRKIGTHAISMF